jgi:hypothetical protein
MMLKSIIIKTLKRFEDILECPAHRNVSFMFLLSIFPYFNENQYIPLDAVECLPVIVAFLRQESKQDSIFTSVRYGST